MVAVVAPAAEAVHVSACEDLLGFHIVVLVCYVSLAGAVAGGTADLLLEVRTADKRVFHVDVAQRTPGKGIRGQGLGCVARGRCYQGIAML